MTHPANMTTEYLILEVAAEQDPVVARAAAKIAARFASATPPGSRVALEAAVDLARQLAAEIERETH